MFHEQNVIVLGMFYGIRVSVASAVVMYIRFSYIYVIFIIENRTEMYKSARKTKSAFLLSYVLELT